MPWKSLLAPTPLLLLLALAAACGAATPGARWSDEERQRILGEFPNCKYGEDAELHAAGYECDLGSFLAYDVPAGEPTPATVKRLAAQYAEQPFTAPLDQINEREQMQLDGESYRMAVATYKPKPETIVPAEVMMIFTPNGGETRRAFTCSIVLLAGLDTESAIKQRMNHCLKGLGMLMAASH